MSPTLHLVLNRIWPVGVYVHCILSKACLIVNLQIIDYLTANNPSVQPPLNDSQKANLYAEFASGGETGWDFSMRWFPGSPSKVGGLVSLNVRNMVGPDLNGILCELSLLSKMMQDSNWGLIYILQTRTILRWQTFTVLPMKLQLTCTRPLLHPSKLVFWIFFGIHKKLVVYSLFFEFNY